MNTTRRQLYAAGEPLGDCATRTKPGGRIYGGGGGGGSTRSDSSNSTTTNNADNRQVLDNGAIGISGGVSGSTITLTDAGAINAGRDVALASIGANATNTDHLLSAADSLFKQTANTLQANTKLAGELAGTAQTAYADAAAQASGNKNLILVGLAIVGLVAVKSFGK